MTSLGSIGTMVSGATAILLAPAVISLLGYANLPDRIHARHGLPDKHLNLPRYRGFRRATGTTAPSTVTISSGLCRCVAIMAFRFLIITVGHFSGGGPHSKTHAPTDRHQHTARWLENT